MLVKRKVLLISNNKDIFTTIRDTLPASRYSAFFVNTILEAKKKLQLEKIDIVIIHTPIKDEFGVKSAREIVRSFNVGVVLMVKNDIFDSVSYMVQDESIYVVSLPTNKNIIFQSVSMMNTYMLRKSEYEAEIKKLKKKIQDDKIINRCKLLLVEQYHWSEDKAHRYLEKTAMDSSMTRVEVAQKLLERMNKK